MNIEQENTMRKKIKNLSDRVDRLSGEIDQLKSGVMVEWVVQTRMSGYPYVDTTFAYTEKQKAIDYVRSARQLDSYEYRVVRRETREVVEVG